MSEIQKLWNIISLQLLYQSFINALQRVIQKDVESENAQIFIAILEAINQYHLGGSTDGDGDSDSGGSDSDGGEEQLLPQQALQQLEKWEYLESHILKSQIDDACALYHYILD